MLSKKLQLQNILLRKTFKVSLLTEEQSQKKNLNKIALTSVGFFGSNYQSFYCKSVRDQITQLGIGSLVDLPNLFDSIIAQKLNSLGQIELYISINTLTYLCEAFISCEAEQKKSMNQDSHSASFLKLSIDMILNYALLFIQTPQMFQKHIPSIQNFTSQPQAIAAAIDDLLIVSGFKLSFFNIINERFYKQIPELFRQVYRYLLLSLTIRINNHNFAQIDTNNDFSILCILMQNQQIKPLLYQINQNGISWLPKFSPGFGGSNKAIISGDMLESSSLLGIYLSKSILPKDSYKPQKEFYERTEKIYYQLTHQKSKVLHDKVKKRIQQNILNYAESLFQLIKNLIKGSHKEAVFEWFGASIQGNLSRTKLGAELMQQSMFTFNLSKVSSDGLMLNQLYVLLKFCKPFLKVNDNKLKKIDPTYLYSGRRFKIKSETPLCTNKNQGEEAKVVFQQNYGTISQFFFLALQSMHIGYLSIIQKFPRMDKQLNQLKKLKSKISQHHPDYIKIDQQVKALQQKRLIYIVQLLEPSILKDISQLYYILISQILQWGQVSKKTCSFKEPPCQILKVFPEHLLFDYSKFMELYYQQIDESIQTQQIAHVKKIQYKHNEIFLDERDILNLHYLHEKLECYHKSFLANRTTQTYLQHIKIGLKTFLCKQPPKTRLNHNALLHLYVEVQSTGSSNQFYEKFHHRNLMSLILQILWRSQFLIDSTRAIIQDPIFEKFLNTLVNDTSWCLDEGLGKLGQIKKQELKIEQGHVMNNEEQKNSDQTRGTVKAVFSIANQSMKLLKSVSQWAREVFYLPSITQATAQMLNFVIMSLVGPNSLQLQVSNPEKLAFRPVSILQDVILMLTSLGSNEDFCTALVQDERSFKIQYYQKAKRILKKQGVIQCIPNFQALIQLLCEKDTGELELLGDPPQQFVCPLSCDLMKEPVFVKTCQKVCEKSFIKRIILNDGKDPYNRKPLSQQDLEECVELKARIQKWIKQKLAGQVTDEDLRIQKENQEQASKADHGEDVKMQVEKSAFDDDYEDDPNYNGNQGANQFGMINNQFQNQNDDEMDADLLLALQLSMNDNNNNGQ